VQTIPAFRFERGKLDAAARQNGAQFVANEPFPHIVIPNFFPPEIANAIASEFPKPSDIDWRLAGPGDAAHTNDPDIEKITTSNEEKFPPLIRHMMHEFNSGTFVNFLGTLTGFNHLSPDPSFHGCGLHSTGRGGRLMVHADASRHPNPKLHQILNMIYYVTPDWQTEWGGGLELWDQKPSKCVKTILPEFNSMLVFYTGTKSYHGHPHPLTCPKGVRRNSLAAYYYTTDRMPDESYDGYKNYVKWVRTTEEDKNVTALHRGKELIRTVLPASAVNRLASMWRQSRR
jgi:hypothetical protein